MMQFETQSGSVYEIEKDPGDPDKYGRVRRLAGIRDPTPRQGKDGEWREFYHLSPITVGGRVLIFWDKEGKATLTSPVTEIRETEDES